MQLQIDVACRSINRYKQMPLVFTQINLGAVDMQVTRFIVIKGFSVLSFFRRQQVFQINVRLGVNTEVINLMCSDYFAVLGNRQRAAV